MEQWRIFLDERMSKPFWQNKREGINRCKGRLGWKKDGGLVRSIYFGSQELNARIIKVKSERVPIITRYNGGVK